MDDVAPKALCVCKIGRSQATWSFSKLRPFGRLHGSRSLTRPSTHRRLCGSRVVLSTHVMAPGGRTNRDKEREGRLQILHGASESRRRLDSHLKGLPALSLPPLLSSTCHSSSLTFPDRQLWLLPFRSPPLPSRPPPSSTASSRTSLCPTPSASGASFTLSHNNIPVAHTIPCINTKGSSSSSTRCKFLSPHYT